MKEDYKVRWYEWPKVFFLLILFVVGILWEDFIEETKFIFGNNKPIK